MSTGFVSFIVSFSFCSFSTGVTVVVYLRGRLSTFLYAVQAFFRLGTKGPTVLSSCFASLTFFFFLTGCLAVVG